MTEISSFREIVNIINEETMLVLDIDETILHYTGINKEYWSAIYSTYIKELNDCEKAEERSLEEWTKLVKISRPKHTDEEGITILFEKIKNTKAILFFLTARKHEMMDETQAHFEELGLPKNATIFYNAKNKGARLKEIIDLGNLGDGLESTVCADLKNYKIVFVDDLDKNLISVKKTLGDKVSCFKFLNNNNA